MLCAVKHSSPIRYAYISHSNRSTRQPTTLTIVEFNADKPFLQQRTYLCLVNNACLVHRNTKHPNSSNEKTNSHDFRVGVNNTLLFGQTLSFALRFIHATRSSSSQLLLFFASKIYRDATSSPRPAHVLEPRPAAVYIAISSGRPITRSGHVA